jgi:hypothetical protein
MRTSLYASVLAALLAGAAGAAAATPIPAEPSLVEQAAAAYGVYDVGRAEALYRQAADDRNGKAFERAVARREQARIAWLVDGDADRATALLEASIPQDPDPCPAALLYARILSDARGKAAAPWIEDVAGRCVAIEPGVAIERVRVRMLAAAAGSGRERGRLLGIANSAWDQLPVDARSGPSAARLQLSLGLISRDAERAFAGWHGYFGLEPGEEAPQGLRESVSDPRGTLRRGLASSAAPRDRLALAMMLLRAGFHEDLERFVAGGALAGASRDNPAVRTVTSYLRLRSALASAILAHDRRVARDRAADTPDYEEMLRRLLREAVAALGETGEDPWPALRRHFNLYGVIGKSNGVSSLHLGHVVIDDRLDIAQGKRAGIIRFIAIDMMVHNGFSAWLIDGAGGAGGWAADGTTIVQVRPRFLAGVETALAAARPGPARDRALREIETKRLSDQAIAAAQQIAFLPGVRDRLRLNGIDDIAAQVRASGRSDAMSARAFRKAYGDATFGSAILAHEGRHVLDQAEFTGARALANDELEYRAKLSEIALAASPRLALSSIYSPLFGGTSGHGIANRRLAGDLARWIEANRGQIVGHDPARTPLEQLDLLSNEQLRAIAGELDAAIQAKDIAPAPWPQRHARSAPLVVRVLPSGGVIPRRRPQPGRKAEAGQGREMAT